MTEGARDQGRSLGGVSRRAAARLAWSLWVLSLTLVSLGLLLLILNWSRAGMHLLEYWPEDYWPEEMFVGVAFSTVGALIASRHHEHPIGWIFCAIGLVAGADYLSAQYATYSLLAQRASVPGSEVLAWVNSWVSVPHIGLYVFLALLFPDGRLPSARWRAVAWVFAVVVVGGTAMVALSPGPISGFEPIGNPFGVEGLPNLTALVEALVYTLTLVAVGSVFARLRRSRGVQRQQVKWFAYAASILATCAALTYLVSEAYGRRVGAVGQLCAGHGWLCGSAACGGHRRTSLPSLQHRPHHKPHAGLRYAHRDACARVLRWRDGDPSNLPHPHRPGIHLRHRGLHPSDCSTFQSTEASHTVLHR